MISAILEPGFDLMGLGGLALMMLACISAASLIVLTIRKAAPAPSKLPVTAHWVDELSTERYQPMLRLLDRDDFRVLREQGGYDGQMISRLRRQRCQIFAGYLGSLQDDFGQVCFALKLLMVHAGEDRPDLATVLIRSRIRFAWAMTVVKVRLTLFRCGIGSVDAAKLLRNLGHLQGELRSLVPSVALSA